MIDVNGKQYMTLFDPIYVNGRRVNQVIVNGTVVYPCLPEKIMVAIHPTKMVYNLNEDIDYSGMRVECLNPNGTLWKSVLYPDGRVPDSELILPIKSVQDSSIKIAETEGWPLYIRTYNPLSVTSHATAIIAHYSNATNGQKSLVSKTKIDFYAEKAYCYLVKSYGNAGASYRQDRLKFIAASDQPGTCTVVESGISLDDDSILWERSETYPLQKDSFSGYDDEELEWYWYRMKVEFLNNYKDTDFVYPPKDVIPTYSVHADWEFNWLDPNLACNMALGTVLNPDNRVLPVQWKRPGDDKMLETSITIAVNRS